MRGGVRHAAVYGMMKRYMAGIIPAARATTQGVPYSSTYGPQRRKMKMRTYRCEGRQKMRKGENEKGTRCERCEMSSSACAFFHHNAILVGIRP